MAGPSVSAEPTTAVDVTTQAQILEPFGGLSDELGMATLLVTHDRGVVAGHADRVFVMYAGREATTKAIFEAAAAPVCAEEEPAMRAVGPGHQAACHFPLKEAVPA